MPRPISDRLEDAFPEVPGFVVEGVLGRGSMATVYRARQLAIDRPVALKVLRPELLSDPREAERILGEARMAARFNHPHAIRVLDAGVHEGLGWLAMDPIDGRSVREILEREGPFAEDAALRVAVEIAGLLDHFASVGVVHRDVKPGNIMIDAEGRALLGDFGLATVVYERRPGTKHRAVGTPAYMSPEQATDPTRVTIRSDFFSLGATLYHMVTGTSGFDAPTVGEVITKILYDEPRPPRELAPELSPAFESVILRLLAKNPEDRPPTPKALIAELERIVTGRERRAGRRRFAWVSASVIALASAAIVAGLLLGPADRDPEAVPSRDLAPPELAPEELAIAALHRRAATEGEGSATSRELDRRVEGALERAFGRVPELLRSGEHDAALAKVAPASRHALARELSSTWEGLPEALRLRLEAERLEVEERILEDRRRDWSRRLSAVEERLRSRREQLLERVAAGADFPGPDEVAAAFASAGAEDEVLFDEVWRGRIEAARRRAAQGLLGDLSDRVEARLETIRHRAEAGHFAAAREELRSLGARRPERVDSRFPAAAETVAAQIDAVEKDAGAGLREALARVAASGEVRGIEAEIGAALAALGKALRGLPRGSEGVGPLSADLELARRWHEALALLERRRERLARRLEELEPGSRLFVELGDGSRLEGWMVAERGDEAPAGSVVLVEPGGSGRRLLGLDDLAPSEWDRFLEDEAGAPLALGRAWLALRGGRPLAALDALSGVEADDPARGLLRPALDAALAEEEGVTTPAETVAARSLRALIEAARRGDWEQVATTGRTLLDDPELAGGPWLERRGEHLESLVARAAAELDLARRFPGAGARARVLEPANARVLLRVDPEIASLRALLEIPEAWGVEAPAPSTSGSAASIVRRRPAAGVAPDAVAPLGLRLPFDPDRGPVSVRFDQVAAPDETPRLLALEIAGRHVAFLDRLRRRGHLAHLPLHGLEKDLAEWVTFGRAAAWTGGVEGYEEAFRASPATEGLKALEPGGRRAVELRLWRGVLEFRLEGRLAARVESEGDASKDKLRLSLRLIRPGRIEGLVIEGCLDQEGR